METERIEKTRLGRVLQRALADGGKVLIPAFALGRTQELLYEMDRLFGEGNFRVPIFLDSPLGLEITKVYAGLFEYWDREARAHLSRGDHPIDFEDLYAVRRHSDHRDLVRTKGPMVILAGSGMCTGGRIVNHMMDGIEKPENDILFVGLPGAGNAGAGYSEMVRGAGWVCGNGGTKASHQGKSALDAWLLSSCGPERIAGVGKRHGRQARVD